jgi:hypothetical protein
MGTGAAGEQDPRPALLTLYDQALPSVYRYLLSRCVQGELGRGSDLANLPGGGPRDPAGRQADIDHGLARSGGPQQAGRPLAVTRLAPRAVWRSCRTRKPLRIPGTAASTPCGRGRLSPLSARTTAPCLPQVGRGPGSQLARHSGIAGTPWTSAARGSCWPTERRHRLRRPAGRRGPAVSIHL